MEKRTRRLKVTRQVLKDKDKSKTEVLRKERLKKLSLNHKLVLVEWVDSYGCSSNWNEIPDKPPVAHYCYSVGWVFSQSRDCIVIVPHISPENTDIGADEQGCGDMTIPTVSIKTITDL